MVVHLNTFCIIYYPQEEKEPWKAFLSQVDWEFGQKLFERCLSRVCAILSIDCIHDSLSCNRSVFRLINLADATCVLQSLYKKFEDLHLLCLHQAIAEDSLFVKIAVDFNCATLKFSGMYSYCQLLV